MRAGDYPMTASKRNTIGVSKYNNRVTLIIAAKSQSDIVVGSDSLVVCVDADNPDVEVGRKTGQQKIFMLRPDTALLVAGTFNGIQMDQFIRTMCELVKNNNLTNVYDIAGQVGAWASSILKLKPHHTIEFIVAGFNDTKPALDLITSKNNFNIGTPRGQFLIGGDGQYGHLLEVLTAEMATKEVKEIVRNIITTAKKNNPDLGGTTIVRTLRRRIIN